MNSDTPVNPVIAEIARKHLGVQTLNTARSDSKDFHELAVWSIQAALQAAFEAGQRSKEAR